MTAIISTAAHVDKDRPPGFYRVSKATGLYLQVSETRSKSWVYRFRLGGERRAMGLGAAYKVSLSDARKAATAAEALRDQGRDPIEARRVEKVKRIEAWTAKTRSSTFKACAERFWRRRAYPEACVRTRVRRRRLVELEAGNARDHGF